MCNSMRAMLAAEGPAGISRVEQLEVHLHCAITSQSRISASTDCARKQKFESKDASHTYQSSCCRSIQVCGQRYLW